MKKILITALLAGLALQQALSQTNVPETSQDAMSETNAPAAPAMSDEMAGAVATNQAVTAADAESAAATNTTTMVDAKVPLISFQDVPLTTVIQSLARAADINYMLDPSIVYGQPDQNGQTKTEPTLTIRWENITAKQALLAVLDNYNLQLVVDRTIGIDRITPKDPTAPPPLITRVIQLKYAGVSNMVDSIQTTLTDKRSRVLADTRTSQLVVVATQPEQDAVDTLVSQLDTPTRQVLIETRLIEISSNPSTAKGIDWSGTLAAQNIGFGNNLNASPTTVAPGYWGLPPGSTNGTPLVTGATEELASLVNKPNIVADTASGFGSLGFLNADGVSAVLSFLNSSADAQVISTPRVVTLDNEPATISVTRAFPVINVTASTPNTTGGSTINYSNIGTVLTVTPRISANDYIWLKVIPDVSSFFDTETKVIDNATYQADVFDMRHIETQVLIPNANTLVMGGMVTDDPNSTYTKVPILGDIPILGYAFRSESKTEDKDNLLIFITPTIVQDADFHPTASSFLDSQPIKEKPAMNPNSLLDSSKPYDWSNPKQTDPDQEILNQQTTE
ncbi:MAG TPA: secretin N-terminal domain-containing protein [Candidatus Saccharimonadales bacterium]|nr:secretin N-terminal domain-containing protein [Candidatus Saccharimonadales bacterium]